MDESGFRHHYTPTNEMMKNLEKIFKFYALLHMPIHTSHKLTFDQINHQNKIVSLSEFYLRKTAKDGKDNNVEFTKFCDILIEIFYLREKLDTIENK